MRIQPAVEQPGADHVSVQLGRQAPQSLEIQVAIVLHSAQSIGRPLLHDGFFRGAHRRHACQVVDDGRIQLRQEGKQGVPNAGAQEALVVVADIAAVAVPDGAQALIDQTAMILPHVKITELLLEVDEWTGFTRHFMHLKSGDLAKDKNLLLTTILADAINLGLTKMAESCPGTTYAKLA